MKSFQDCENWMNSLQAWFDAMPACGLGTAIQGTFRLYDVAPEALEQLGTHYNVRVSSGKNKLGQQVVRDEVSLSYRVLGAPVFNLVNGRQEAVGRALVSCHFIGA